MAHKSRAFPIIALAWLRFTPKPARSFAIADGPRDALSVETLSTTAQL